VSYLVDANVLCEVTRPQAAPRVLAWLERHDEQLHVSAITLGEILKGIRLLPAGRRRRALQDWFAELESSFEGRVLPIDQEVMREWAALYAASQQAGHRLPAFDSLLAATAKVHDLTVVTRNRSDFPPSLPVLDPWRGG